MTTAANPFTNKRTSTPPKAAAAAAAPAAEPAFSSAPGAGGGDPFSMPSGPGSGEKITDFEGYLLLVKPTELVHGMQTKLGATDAVRADLVVLDYEDGPHESDGVLVFQQALRRDLTRTIEGPTEYLLGRLGRAEAKEGKSAAYIFEQPNEDDMTAARNYLKGRK